MEDVRHLVETHAPSHGLFPTGLDGVSLYRKTTPNQRQPAVMPPLLNIVVQGTKYAYLDATTYRYGAGTYICAPTTLPIEAEATEASEDEPILGVQIMLNTRAMTELLVDLNEHKPPLRSTRADGPELAPTVVEWDDTFATALGQLLVLLDDNARRQALGPGRLRELLYLVLTGPAGPPLWHTLGQSHDLNHTIGFIRDHLDQPLSIDDLAQQAGMSRPVFDRRFRGATSYAPLQFIKALRLNAAATLITEGSDITTAASNVGYASPAQFSRDFKRHYGQPPKQWSRTAEALEPTA
ncbi:MAG: AraC family transcriptional regulator [Actinomycetota bacterium]